MAFEPEGPGEDCDLKKCPNCACGVPGEAMLCEYCGAVVVPSETTSTLEVCSIVCSACGAENPPDLTRCTRCSAPLRQVCPRCGAETLARQEKRCPRCMLPRTEFYAECGRVRRAKEEARRAGRKRAQPRNHVFLFLAILFCGLGGYTDLSGEVWEAAGFLALAGVFLFAWLFTTNPFGEYKSHG